MRIKFRLVTIALIYSSRLMAQETTQFSKECRISSGYTYANGINNSKGGSSIFFQMSYKVSPKFSIATEFENLNFEMPGYHEDLPIKPNIQNIFDNYFSLMIKYHLPLKSKFNAELASGWTFYTNQNEYYDYYKDATTESISYKVTSFSDFGIPFLLETHYPLWKNFNTGIRVKYNFNPGQNSTYSVGIGVSLIL